MTTERKFLLDKIIEQRNNASNTFEKRIWNRQIANIEKGLCPYGCKPEKNKKLEEKELQDFLDKNFPNIGNAFRKTKISQNKDRFNEVANHERLIVGNEELDKKYDKIK